MNKIKNKEQLISIIKKLKDEGKVVVATSGCFDILHAGHVLYLERAKEKGNILIILLNSDKSIRKLKGEERPIIPEEERIIVVSGLECVDYVCLFDETNPCNLLEEIKPDIFVKGEDYKGVHIPEIDVLERYGGKVELVGFLDGCSSSSIIEKIKGLVK